MLNANYFSTYGTCMMISALYLLYRNRGKKRGTVLLITAAALGMFVVVIGQSRTSFMVNIGCIISWLIFLIKDRKSMAGGGGARKKYIIVGIIVIAALFTIILLVMNTSDTSLFDRYSIKGKSLDLFTAGRHQYGKIMQDI